MRSSCLTCASTGTSTVVKALPRPTLRAPSRMFCTNGYTDAPPTTRLESSAEIVVAIPASSTRMTRWTAGLAAGEELLRPTGDQLEQQVVDTAHRFGTGPAQLVAAVHQQPQRYGGVIGGHRAQSGAAQLGDGHAVGVDRVGLAALAGVEHPHPRRQLGRHIQDSFAVGDQALGDVAADPGATLDGPNAIGKWRPAASMA
jgi:hypothetical protein